VERKNAKNPHLLVQFPTAMADNMNLSDLQKWSSGDEATDFLGKVDEKSVFPSGYFGSLTIRNRIPSFS
jgi:hypothetical protein